MSSAGYVYVGLVAAIGFIMFGVAHAVQCRMSGEPADDLLVTVISVVVPLALTLAVVNFIDIGGHHVSPWSTFILFIIVGLFLWRFLRGALNRLAG